MTDAAASLQAQLLRDEGGMQLRPYKDSRGLLTIGVGHCLDRKPMSAAALMQQFRDDLAEATTEVWRAFPWADGLDDVRRGVLINMTFQMGIGGVGHFHEMLTALHAGNWAAAAAAMRESLWHTQTPERCERLATQVLTGMWQ